VCVCVCVILKGKIDNVTQSITSVYGPYKRELRPDFWQSSSFSNRDGAYPWNLRGDFNIIHHTYERKGEKDHYRQEFNFVINQAKLMDLPLKNRVFTWLNLQNGPILARLDRVLVLSEWESHFLLASLYSLPRPTFDHVPSCLDSRETVTAKRKIFHFKRNVDGEIGPWGSNQKQLGNPDCRAERSQHSGYQTEAP